MANQTGILARIKGKLSGSSTMAADDGPRMQVAQIAAKIGLPEDKVAQIISMIKMHGMDDAQRVFMMITATGRGIKRDEIMTMMTSMGLGKEQIIRNMETAGLMEPEEAELALQEEMRKRQQAADAEKEKRRYVWMKKAGIIFFWLAIWELLDRIMDNRLVLAGPIRVLEALADQVVKPDFWMICGASFVRIAAGFLLAFAAGLILALIANRFRLVRDFIEPIISLLRTIPVISFIIMLLIWVGNQALTVYLAFLIVLPLIYTNTLTGFESVDKQMLEMAHVYKLSKWRTFMYVYRPAFMPFLTSSAKISLGMSWKSGIMAEVIATPKPSIGKEMSQARTYLNTPDLFAWTVVVMILSLIFEKAFLEFLKIASRPLGQFLGTNDDDGSDAAGHTSGKETNHVLDTKKEA